MTTRFTIQDRKDLATFRSILDSVADVLPLDFIIGVYKHVKNNPRGYDTTWLQRALVTAKEVAEAQQLNVDSQGVLLASVMLMETGRGYIGADPQEGSVAFAIAFINKVASRYFDDDEIRSICNCLRYNRQRFRRSVDGAFVIMVSEVSILNNVRFNDIDAAVISYVKENKCGPNDSNADGVCQIDSWLDSLATGFNELYGHNGSIWTQLTNASRSYFQDHILLFKQQASNKTIIRSVISQNQHRIFSR